MKVSHSLSTDSLIMTSTSGIRVTSRVNDVTRASMAAALQTTPHVDDERARQHIQHVMVPEMVIRARQHSFL